jgi:hypothetical protein
MMDLVVVSVLKLLLMNLLLDVMLFHVCNVLLIMIMKMMDHAVVFVLNLLLVSLNLIPTHVVWFNVLILHAHLISLMKKMDLVVVSALKL